MHIASPEKLKGPGLAQGLFAVGCQNYEQSFWQVADIGGSVKFIKLEQHVTMPRISGSISDQASSDSFSRGFSLVEILVIIAVIGVISALVIPQISNIRSSASLSVARQQQAELQAALGNWVVARSSEPGGLAAARAAYTGTKLSLLENYLQEATYASMSGSGDAVTSAALDAAGAYLQFSSWASGQYPTVQWINR
jgi:Tfp pilus assembly protein FimT